VDQVIAALEERQRALGAAAADDSEHAPHHPAATTLGYLRNQRSRMRYATYRQQGLPTTSSYVESTVKRIHRRVKGTRSSGPRAWRACSPWLPTTSATPPPYSATGKPDGHPPTAVTTPPPKRPPNNRSFIRS